MSSPPYNSIVDAHVHLLPGRLAIKVREFFDRHISWGRLVFPLDHATILDMLHTDGIGMVWSLPYAHKGGVASGMNASSAATVAEFRGGPVEVVGGATVHPQDDDPAGVVREALDLHGLRVLKLHCSVGNFQADDPALMPVWSLVAHRQMPVVIHVGHAVSGHSEADELAAIERVAQTFPQAPVIIAHCGHHSGNAALDLVEKYPAVYADLTPVVFEPVNLPAERVQALSAKLLFGSDAPNAALTIRQLLDHLKSWNLTPEAEEAILGGNARKLLKGQRP